MSYAHKNYWAFIVVSVAVFASPAYGSIVASWDLNNGPGTADDDPGSQAFEPAAFSAVGITGNNMIRGAGLATSAAAASFSSQDWDDNTADEFMEFGFTIAAGYTVDLTDLTIATRSSATGPLMMGLYTSLDGFTTAIHTFNQSPGANFVNSIVDLSSLALLSSGTFAVRLIEVGNTQADGVGLTASAGTFRISEYSPASGTFVDVQFNGVITAPRVVPEASAFLIWCTLCGSVMVGLKRFRHSWI